ncbi:replication protein A 70 kDa DNA-binding subunit-like [Eriocheir sinensis]|uniref:replication protein A 70 kDa DNA-binding subunit-like n=1 Tax=Eriocheir sinensis TaxID=95602 RepID=UPI0021CA5C51|nr:replication protein A 70 kDa DNA-binding subunit-like [Eriocheir sinensis]XP_050714390.1 replication protein A 70 kDa DNA-binding subunit-like [Eriocheir sinensis]XP_050714391.1 replication protein A 70 kDa DNA-binding subunit-like [Eriocheir sinensis]
METLSSGVIADIIEGGHPDKPVVQILSMKRIPSGAQERWRLLLSDGQWSSSFAMLATQLNSKVDTGEIKNNCIISLDRYVCNTVQENKKVLIILDLSVVKTGEEVGQKLGSPVTYDPNKNAGQQQQQPAQKQLYKPPVPKVTPSAGPTGGNVQRNPLAQHNVPTREPAITKTPSGGNVHPIEALTPYQNRWTICARVTNKSAIRTWSNSRGEGKLFSMDLLDESGEIRATAFNEQCDKFYDMIEIDKVYFISTATLKTANKQYSNLNNEYEMTFNRGTEVTPCHESTAIPTMQFNFVSFDQLEGLSKDSIVDVIGVCKETFDISFVTMRSSGKELTKRDLQLIDSTAREVRLTIWGTQAETFDGSQQPVVAVKGAKVSDFSGISLSTLSSSCLQINPDIREAHMVKGWFDNGGNVAQTQNLSGKNTAGGVTGDFKLFAEAQQKTGVDNPEYCCLKGVIVMVRKENSMYAACPKEGCNKKVVDQGSSQYRCEKCDQSYDSFKWRIMLGVCVADISDSHWVTIFQDEAQRLLNTTSDELGLMKETNNVEFEKIMDSILFKNYNFKLRCKIETYNGESRWKPTVMSFAPVNPKEHGRRLLTEMKQMAGES